MTVVYKRDLLDALTRLGLEPGGTVIFHSSLKSLGHVVGGADTVIDAFLETVDADGKHPTGTVLVPTLIQKDFMNAYRTWSLDKPSDVGYITEVFRHRPGALRSNQATHSVAAIGRRAAEMTADHGKSGKRWGVFGDTPYAVASPWQKLHDSPSTVVLIGVDMSRNTCKHLLEYQLINDTVAAVPDEDTRTALRARIMDYDPAARTFLREGRIWPFYPSSVLEPTARELGLLRETVCGDARLMAFDPSDVTNLARRLFDEMPEHMCTPEFRQWLADARVAVK